MDQKNIKKRDLMDFDKFSESYEKASKLVMLKNGENPHPGAHEIKGEDLFVRNDANPYDAAGIKYNEDQANVNPKYMNANQVDVFVNGKLSKKDQEKADANYANQVVVHHQSAIILDEAAKADDVEFKPEDMEKTIEKDEDPKND